MKKLGMVGTPEDSEVIEGIALRKNVSRKGSSTAVQNAAVYLLGSGVELSDSDRKPLTSLGHPSLHDVRPSPPSPSALLPLLPILSSYALAACSLTAFAPFRPLYLPRFCLSLL